MRETGSGDASLTFGVLGAFEATYAGTPLRLGGRQQRAILALLVCESGHAVPVERLIRCVWRDPAPAGAVTSVQTYVFHLRQLLEPDRPRGSPGSVLVTDPGGYRLVVAPGSVDLSRFEALVSDGDAALARHEPDQAVTSYDAALALWRGDVLADLSDYDFVTALRARLEEQRASALQSRIAAELDLGHHQAVLADLGDLVHAHPLREEFHAQRILALYRSGRQSDALAAYRELHSLLDTELGIEPSPPLRELNNRVLTQDPSLEWQPPAPPARSPQVDDRPYEREHAPQQPAGRRRGRIGAVALTLVALAGLMAGATVVPPDPLSATPAVPANTVSELDASGAVLASVPVGTNPIALARGGEAIWVVNAGDDTASKIDPSTRSVRQVVDVGHDPRALAVTGDDLWVTNFGDGTVSRINLPASRVVDTIDVGSGPYAIAAGPAGLWVANSGDNTVQRIDPGTGRTGRPVDVGDGPDGLAVDDSSVWVANGRSGSVMRLDPTGAALSSPIRVGSGPRGIVRVGDDVWVADELSQSVTRIDVASGHTTSFDVGDGPTAVVALGRGVWVAEKYSGDLTRFDAAATKTRIPVGAALNGLAVADGHVWVAAGALPAASHRGGTLRVASASLPGADGGIDPAAVYDRTTYHAERVVYDGLLAYHYSSADPNVIVPDLATAVPEPTDGGKTYTFTLRPGIRYSTGAEVRASDLVRGVHRALSPSAARADLYAGIVGGQACIDHPARCDLSEGVVADDATGRVTFKLRQPDPEFLSKLTFLVVPAPPGTTLGSVTSPLPGTGPYEISSYARGTKFALTRNRYFKQWSAAAQPAGFLDALVWVKADGTRAAADAVRQGRDDLAELTPLYGHAATDGALVDSLRVAAPNQVHGSLFGGTTFGVINSSRPPFDNVLARRAFNYAVDRTKAVQLLGGPSVAIETCQLLPPTMPSYRPYCPYTRGPPDGGYHGPDLDRARALAAASGTLGTKVVVTDVVGDYNPRLEAYFARVLRDIGYQVTLRRLPDTTRNEALFYDARSGIQVQTGGWIADFPLPSNFYEIVSCVGAGESGFYRFDHCNRALDRRAYAAKAQMQSEPGSALRSWTAIDRAVTDDAPMVPVASLVDWWMTSKRVGNYQGSLREVGPLLSQLWIH